MIDRYLRWSAVLFTFTAACVESADDDAGELPETEAAALAPEMRYVSPTGNDANPGTLAAPWRSIQRAADLAQPGWTIFVRAGTYDERVVICSGGSAVAGPVTFKPYGDGAVIVDGGTFQTVARTQVCGWPAQPDIVKVRRASPATFNVLGASYVTIEGFEVRNTCTTGINPDGCDYFYYDGEGVRTWGRTYPRAFQVNPGFTGDVLRSPTDITIRGNTIRRIDHGDSAIAVPIIVSGGNRALVPARTNKPVERVRIESNTFRDSDLQCTAIGEQGCPSDTPLTHSHTIIATSNVSDVLISRNVMTGLDGLGISPGGNTDWLGRPIDLTLNRSRNVVVSDNTIRDQDGNAMYIQGAFQVLVERNYIAGGKRGIGVATETAGANVTGRIWIRDNIFDQTAHHSLMIGKLSGSIYGHVDDFYVTNNSFYMAPLAGRENDQPIHLGGLIGGQSALRNNLVVSARQLLIRMSEPADPSTITANHNLWWTTGGPLQLCGGACPFSWREDMSVTWTPWSTYRLLQDAAGMFTNPWLQGLGGDPNAFRLQQQSPARDTGTLSRTPPWPTNFGVYAPTAAQSEKDFFGENRVHLWSIDIGADERNTL